MFKRISAALFLALLTLVSQGQQVELRAPAMSSIDGAQIAAFSSNKVRHATGTPAPTYATWNPSDKASSLNLSGGNLVVTATLTSDFESVRANIGKSTGKHCFEATYTNTSDYGQIGFGTSAFTLTGYLGQSEISAAYNVTENTVLYKSASITQANSTAPGSALGPYMLCTDIGAGKAWIILSNVVASGGDPAAGTTPTWTWTPGITIYPAISLYRPANVMTGNFGAMSFGNTLPSGFTGWYN